MTKKEFRQKLRYMIKNFEYWDWKKKAWKEFDDLREKQGVKLDDLIHICHVIDDYPDFNHIEFKVTKPNMFVIKICLDIEYLKKLNDKQLNKVADSFYKKFVRYSKLEGER